MADTKTTKSINKKKKLSYKKLFAVALVFVIAIVTIINIINAKNYNKKIKLVMDGLYSQSKMEQALKSSIDVKAAIAWQNAGKDSKEFENKLKEIKNNDEKIEKVKKALKNYSTRVKTLEERQNNVQNVEKAVNNKKVKEVKATIDNKEYKFIFYKDKIIDIQDIETEESIFEYIFIFYGI